MRRIYREPYVSVNPFLETSVFNLPLCAEMRQQIHAAALRAAAHGLCPARDTAPEHISPDRLKQQARWHGTTIYLAHPAEIDDIFNGVTLAIYRAVESLYCAQLGLSVEMVWRILSAMAGQASMPPVSYEAVWAICMYLDKRRLTSGRVIVECDGATWWLIQTQPNVFVPGEDNPSAYGAPVNITCVIELPSMRVLAFRIAYSSEAAFEQDALEMSATLAIHDALVSRRRPSRVKAAGLVWRLPAEIISEMEVVSLREACAQMQISVRRADGSLPVPAWLRGEWAQDLAGRCLQPDRLAALFDNHLTKLHGYGPLYTREQQNRQFPYQVRYHRDPDELFPALRNLLPLHGGYITAEGEVECGGLRYAHDLLVYWPGRQVTLRRSEYSSTQRTAPTTAWIYLEGEVLCQAKMRKTGSVLSGEKV
jgi:hypothetical protein